MVYIEPSKISGQVTCPASKSYAHRILIASAFCDEPTRVELDTFCDDTLATIDCLRALGADIIVEPDSVFVRPIINANDDVILDVRESGSTLRFMLPIVAALGIKARFIGHKSILKRPLDDIIEVLEDNGITVSSNHLPLTIEGKLAPNAFSIKGDFSSQYITGMLFAISILGEGCLNIQGDIVSQKYIDITLSVLEDFGVIFVKNKNTYKLISSLYKTSGNIAVESDWSSAAFILSLGVLYGSVDITGLKLVSAQGDKIIYDILRDMGAKVSYENGILHAEKSELKAVDICAKDCPDLVPILAVLCANARGQSVISDVDRLQFKESDRLANVITMLNSMKIHAFYENNAIIINGGKVNSASLYGYNDHRMVMSSVVALLEVGGSVSDEYAVAKSYPQFFLDVEQLGGRVHV